MTHDERARQRRQMRSRIRVLLALRRLDTRSGHPDPPAAPESPGGFEPVAQDRDPLADLGDLDPLAA
jgi:hypothetical protein